MSTRCQIGIFNLYNVTDKEINAKKWEVLLYKHSDGDPKETLPEVLRYVRHFTIARGSDPEYLGACLLTWLKTRHTKKGVVANPEDILVTGHGISNTIHGDIEYFYGITNKDVIVFETNGKAIFKEIERHTI